MFGVGFQFLAAIYLYTATKEYSTTQNRRMAALLFFCFRPNYMYCEVSHYTIAYWLGIACICVSCRIIKNDSKWDYVKLAVTMFASVLALPTLVVLYGVIFIL